MNATRDELAVLVYQAALGNQRAFEQLYRATSVLGGHPYHRPQLRIED